MSEKLIKMIESFKTPVTTPNLRKEKIWGSGRSGNSEATSWNTTPVSFMGDKTWWEESDSPSKGRGRTEYLKTEIDRQDYDEGFSASLDKNESATK
jgi:hypothetical protein